MNSTLASQLAQVNHALKMRDFPSATELVLQLSDPQNREAALAHVMCEWGKDSPISTLFAKLLVGRDREIALAHAAVGRAQSPLSTAGLSIRYALELPPGETRDHAVAEVLVALGRRTDNPHSAVLNALEILKTVFSRGEAHGPGMKGKPIPESPHAVESILKQLPQGAIRDRARLLAERERKKSTALEAEGGERPGGLSTKTAFSLRPGAGELESPEA